MRMAFTVATKVMGVVMISSPGSGLMAAIAVCTAAVPEVTARAKGMPSRFAKASSKSFTHVPRVQLSVPLSSTLRRFSSSSIPKFRPDILPSWGNVNGCCNTFAILSTFLFLVVCLACWPKWRAIRRAYTAP